MEQITDPNKGHIRTKRDLLMVGGVDDEELHIFWGSHLHCRNNNLPEKFRYDITHTGIGDIVRAVCLVCGKTRDITDYRVW